MLNHLERSVIDAAAVLTVSLGASAAPVSAGHSHLLPAPRHAAQQPRATWSRSYYEWTSAAMCLVNAARAKRGLSPYAMGRTC